MPTTKWVVICVRTIFVLALSSAAVLALPTPQTSSTKTDSPSSTATAQPQSGTLRIKNSDPQPFANISGVDWNDNRVPAALVVFNTGGGKDTEAWRRMDIPLSKLAKFKYNWENAGKVEIVTRDGKTETFSCECYIVADLTLPNSIVTRCFRLHDQYPVEIVFDNKPAPK